MGIYQQAYMDKMKDQINMADYNAWVHNQYTLMAIGNALNGKKCKYPKKPFGIKEEEKKRLENMTDEDYYLEMKSAIAKMNGGIKQEA